MTQESQEQRTHTWAGQSSVRAVNRGAELDGGDLHAAPGWC